MKKKEKKLSWPSLPNVKESQNHDCMRKNLVQGYIHET